MNELIFMIVFGKQENEALLRALLNALLERAGDRRIDSLQLQRPNLERSGVVDVKARDGLGRLYNIELGTIRMADFVDRSFSKLLRMFGEQVVVGDRYEDLSQATGIALVDFVLFPDGSDVHTVSRLYDRVHGCELTDALEMHFFELVKFDKDRPQTLQTPADRWLHVLKFGDLYARELAAVPEVLKSEEGVSMAIDKMREARASDQVREMIWAREKAAMDEGNRMATALHTQKEEIARRMLAASMPAEQIIEFTGLDAVSLRKLQQERERS